MVADSVSLPLRVLYLASRREQRCRLSLGGKLDVRCAALDWSRSILLHGLAHVASTLQRRAHPDLSRFGFWQSADGISASMGDSVLCSRDYLCVVAFRLWPVAVRCKMGDCSGTHCAQALGLHLLRDCDWIYGGRRRNHVFVPDHAAATVSTGSGPHGFSYDALRAFACFVV